MGDLKPLGSEKLNGDEKLKRILELTYYKNGSNNTQATKADYITESTTGVYGIVKEKDGYYVKKGLNEGSLDYIGGMFMKNKNKFSSYAEALKRLQLLKGQEELLNEETKYVLKVNKPSANNEAAVPPPPPAPEMSAPPMDAAPAPMDAAPAPEMPVDAAAEMPAELPPADDMGMDAGMDSEMGAAPESEEDKMKVVQKLTGRLGQKLRDIQDEMESDDIKYIINSVLSAVNLDKLESEDKEEILGKFEDEEDFGGEDGMDDEMDTEEMPPAEEPKPEADLGEVDGIDALEGLVNMSFEEDDDIDYTMGKDDENMLPNPEKEINIDVPPMEPEKERTRKSKFHVEPDSEEDLFYRQASLDSDFGDDEDDDDLFGDGGFGDTFHFDLKEVDDEGALSDLYGDEIEKIKNDSEIHDPEFYMDDESPNGDVNELLKMDLLPDNDDKGDDEDREFEKMAKLRFLKLSQGVGEKTARNKMRKTWSKLEKNTPKEVDVNELLKMDSLPDDDKGDDEDREFEKMAKLRFLKLSQKVGEKAARNKMLKTLSKLEKNTPKEIDISELSEIINQSVRETLRKHFE